MDRKDFTRLAACIAWFAFVFGGIFLLNASFDRPDDRLGSILILPVLLVAGGCLAAVLDIRTRRQIRSRNRPWTVDEGWFLYSLRSAVIVNCEHATTVLDSVLGALDNAGVGGFKTALLSSPNGTQINGLRIDGYTRGITGSTKTRYRVEIESGPATRDWTVRMQTRAPIRTGIGCRDSMKLIDQFLAHVSKLRLSEEAAPKQTLRPGWYTGTWQRPDKTTDGMILVDRLLRVSLPTALGGLGNPADLPGIRVAAFAPDGTPASADEVRDAAGGAGYRLKDRTAPPAWAPAWA